MSFSQWRRLSADKQKRLMVFSAAIIAIYVLIMYFSAMTMYRNRAHAEFVHAARMSATSVEPGLTPPQPLPATGDFVTVKVGTYFDDIDGFSIRDSAWSTNFYIWFSWQGDASLDPGGKFVLLDGVVLKKDLLDDHHANGANYQRYRVTARIIKFFDTSRVPIDDHMLNVYVEDGARAAGRLRYVADEASNVSSRLKVPGYRVTATSQVVKPHAYKSNYGDSELAGKANVFSQYVAAIQIERIDFGFYFKMLLSLFAAILLALSSFFVHPSDASPRFSLPTGAYFGAVANTYLTNSLSPTSGQFGLVDHISFIGLFTIFITIALSLVSSYYNRHDNRELALALDRAMFWVVGLCCLVANVVVPWCARG